MRKLMMAAAVMVAWCAVAQVPTQAEFTAAGKVIADLMEPQMAAMKSGKKKSAEVADYAMSLVGESETAAAKFLLARRAYGLYMKGGAYDKAVEAIGEMRTAVPDMSNEQMLKAILPATKNVSEKKAPAVYAIAADLKGKVRSQNEIVKLEGELKKAKASESELIHRQLGECHAVMGDWKKALEHFAKSGDDVATMAAAEEDGKADVSKLAGFWWDYSESPTVKKSVATALRQHAIALYKKGLDDGTISGLNKKLAEQRVASGATANSTLDMDTSRPHVPNGLAHRWSFNGDLKDSVSGADAKFGDNAKIANGQCVVNRGWVRLENACGSLKGDFTLEIWTTEMERAANAQVFYMRPADQTGINFAWGTGSSEEGFFHAADYSVRPPEQHDSRGFDLGNETYIAVTCKDDRNGRRIAAYKCSKGQMSVFTSVVKKPLEETKYFNLGSRLVGGRRFSDAISSYNEVRVWTRCLSKGEIERSAKAGPDKLVL